MRNLIIRIISGKIKNYQDSVLLSHTILYKAQNNPVFMTAKTVVCLMAEAGIPDADRIAKRLDSTLGITDPEVVLGNALVVEAKYRTMCRLIQQSGYSVNVDLLCG